MKFRFEKIAVVLLSAVAIVGCFPDDITDNGLSSANLDASFTIVPDNTSPNKFTLKATSTDYIVSKWDLGDGSPAYLGKMDEKIFVPDAGSYTITHYAVGKGGEMKSATQPLNVTTPDPNSGNIVLGGKFETSADIAKWTVLTISSSGTAWTFTGGKATVKGGGWNQQGIYQAINVVKDKTYKIDLIASSTSGCSNTWFEVYCSTTAPTQNSDYNADGMKRSINTWDGCGTTAFSGKISNIGCKADNNKGLFTAPVTGVMYLVIKSGGEDLKDGISIDNVEVRGQ